MRRARLELDRVARGGMAILGDAVPSEPTAAVLVREYNKYLLRRGAALVNSRSPA